MSSLPLRRQDRLGIGADRLQQGNRSRVVGIDRLARVPAIAGVKLGGVKCRARPSASPPPQLIDDDAAAHETRSEGSAADSPGKTPPRQSCRSILATPDARFGASLRGAHSAVVQDTTILTTGIGGINPDMPHIRSRLVKSMMTTMPEPPGPDALPAVPRPPPPPELAFPAAVKLPAPLPPPLS